MWRKSRKVQHKHPGDCGGGERGSLGRHLSLVHREERDTIHKAVRLEVAQGAAGAGPGLHAVATGRVWTGREAGGAETAGSRLYLGSRQLVQGSGCFSSCSVQRGREVAATPGAPGALPAAGGSSRGGSRDAWGGVTEVSRPAEGTAARDGQEQGELPQPSFWGSWGAARGCWRGRGSWLCVLLAGKGAEQHAAVAASQLPKPLSTAGWAPWGRMTGTGTVPLC